MNVTSEGRTRANFKDISRQRFGKWLVLRRVKNNRQGSARWECRCDCGTISVITGGNLRSPGGNRSCRACRSRVGSKGPRRPKEDLMGRRFGRLTVAGDPRHVDGLWRWDCLCDCGARRSVIVNGLVSGLTRSCGCLAWLLAGVEPGDGEAVADQFRLDAPARPIPGHDGYYASRCGRIFSKVTDGEAVRFSEIADRPHPKGYRRVNLGNYTRGTRRAFLVHRLVGLAWLPLPQPGQTQVRHLDDGKTNNHASNLAWGTASDNEQDKIRNGIRNRRA
jgi:hypothetical protein